MGHVVQNLGCVRPVHATPCTDKYAVRAHLSASQVRTRRRNKDAVGERNNDAPPGRIDAACGHCQAGRARVALAQRVACGEEEETTARVGSNPSDPPLRFAPLSTGLPRTSEITSQSSLPPALCSPPRLLIILRQSAGLNPMSQAAHGILVPFPLPPRRARPRGLAGGRAAVGRSSRTKPPPGSRAHRARGEPPRLAAPRGNGRRARAACFPSPLLLAPAGVRIHPGSDSFPLILVGSRSHSPMASKRDYQHKFTAYIPLCLLRVASRSRVFFFRQTGHEFCAEVVCKVALFFWLLAIGFTKILPVQMPICSWEETINEFEMLTRDAGRVQQDTLKKILELNADAEYLNHFGLNGRTDVQSYKSCIPLCVHSDLEPYIQRIADGDSSPLLTGKPLTSLSLSSGTTQGKPKFLPFNDELLETTLQTVQTSYAFRNREYPIGKGKALQFIYSSKQVVTKGGILATTATTNLYRRPRYKEGMKDIQSQCCSPDEVVFGPDFHQALYCHLLCGLIYADEVHQVFSPFAHSLVHAFQTFEEVWEDLCADIRDGVLSEKVTVPSIREAVTKILKPNPELADSIHKKCMGLSNWYGVIPALWPNAKYVYGIMTGSMEPYLKKLRHYAGHLPLISADYGASEGWVGANIHPTLPPEQVTYAVLPQTGYFEFIPLEKPKGEETENSASIHYIESDPVGLTEVKIGKIYEVVITTFGGLYRYRLGDIVKIAGFHNSTPELQFICRRSLVLSINIDKNTEKDLQLAVEEAGKLLEAEKLEILDFTSSVEKSSDPGRYVIFWELSSDASEDVLQSCANCLDLAFVDAGYVGSRKIRTIGPLELRVLKRGTFKEILDHFLSLGGAVSQFKAPRCVNPLNVKVLQILSRNTTRSYFSTAYGL